MKRLSVFLFITLISFSCSNPKNPAVNEIDINGDIVSQFNYDDIQDTLQIKLTELASNLHFVTLETKEECMIGYGQYYVYNRYILNINPFEKILLFTAEGKFVRQVCRSGKGPEEFQQAVIAVDEENDILYVADEVKSYFMSWDLNSGEYLGNVPRPFTGRLKNMLVTKDGNILVAPVVGHFPSGDYYLWEQDLEGNIIRDIKAPHQDFYKDSQSMLLHFNGSGYNYIPYGSDTIYSANNDRFIPSYLVDFGTQNEKLIGKVGGKSFSYKFESERFFCGKVYTLLTVETTKSGNGTYTRTTGKNETLILDKKTNTIYLNEKIKNDFSGMNINLFWMFTQTNRTINFASNAVDFVEQAEKYIEDPKADPKIKARLEKILPTIDIEDNPILIIGTLKN